MHSAAAEVRYSKQFQALAANSVKYSCSAALKNLIKNRYGNIMPFDKTRVILRNKANPSSDYINASYIRGIDPGVEYIASQGPKVETVADHWQMIWENNISLIVMLTKCMDEDEELSSIYWPEFVGQWHRFGDVTVMLKEFTIHESYIERDLLAYNQVSDEVTTPGRVVKQLQFLCWPESGAPAFLEMLPFFTAARTYFRPSSQHRMQLVHCSDGCGRTGAFIALDIMLRHWPHLRLFDLVLMLRSCRMRMVQTWMQLQFINDFAEQFMRHRDRAFGIREENFISYAAMLRNHNFGQVIQQFNRLMYDSAEAQAKFSTSVAMRHYHMNRTSSAIPFNHSRVVLQSKMIENDYINASFIKGPASDRDYIASQAPQFTSAGDYWLMIWQNDVKLIIMLTQCQSEKGEGLCYQYWPQKFNDPIQFSKITIVLKEQQQHSTHTERVLEIKNSQRQLRKCHGKLVTHLQFEKWPPHSLPQLRDFSEFFSHCREQLQLTGYKQPVLVHCSDGSGITGTFIALDLLARSLPNIDVYDTVLQLRRSRMNMVYSWEQYSFIYEFMSMYIQQRRESSNKWKMPHLSLGSSYSAS